MVTRTVHYRARVQTPGEFDTFKWQYLLKTGGQIHELPEYQAHWAARQLANEHQTEAKVVAGVVPVTLYVYDRKTGEVTECAPEPIPVLGQRPTSARDTGFQSFFKERERYGEG